MGHGDTPESTAYCGMDEDDPDSLRDTASSLYEEAEELRDRAAQLEAEAENLLTKAWKIEEEQG